MRRAFTLIEVLVVVIVIALLMAIVMPALARSNRAGRMSKCQNNMRQFHVCWYSYVVDYKDYLPASAGLNCAMECPEDKIRYQYMGDTYTPFRFGRVRMNNILETYNEALLKDTFLSHDKVRNEVSVQGKITTGPY